MHKRNGRGASETQKTLRVQSDLEAHVEGLSNQTGVCFQLQVTAGLLLLNHGVPDQKVREAIEAASLLSRGLISFHEAKTAMELLQNP